MYRLANNLVKADVNL